MLWLNWTKGSHTISVVRWVKGPNYGGVGIVSHWDQQPTCITLEIKVKNPLNKDLAGSGLMCMVFENNSGHNENRETDEWDYSHQDSSVSHTFSIKKGCTKSPLNTSVWFSAPCYTHCIILWGKSWIIWIINLWVITFIIYRSDCRQQNGQGTAIHALFLKKTVHIMRNI